MKSVTEIGKVFRQLGGEFLLSPEALAARLAGIRAFVFDWDGVFNAGRKGGQTASTFGEADSMGTNLLRYALWRRDGALPFVAVISGASNIVARQFAEREHFNAVFTGVRNKSDVFARVTAEHGIEPAECAFIFDDVNDFGPARQCGLRLMIRRRSSPLLLEYAATQGICDYVTGTEGGSGAVREVCEMLLGLSGAFDAVVASRTNFAPEYEHYFAARQMVTTHCADSAY